MNLLLLLQTVRHLRLTQITHQMWHRFYRPKLKAVTPPAHQHVIEIIAPIAKPQCYDGKGCFTFLNISSPFRDWNMGEHGPLWAYNLNYMDWLQQDDISADECLKWIDKFIDGLPDNHVGQDPYPTALRIINWAKFFSRHPQSLGQRRRDSMYAQTILLSKKLEYHLLGNHLLEDAYALFIASVFFNDSHLYQKAKRLLAGQLEEQILPDGAHYEQSPMYHCIMLDRLLDCINFSGGNQLFSGQEQFTALLRQKAVLMLGHLEAVVYNDGSIPLLNDSAYGIAPTAHDLFDYAERLRLSWKAVTLRECGYRKLTDDHYEAVVDIGNMAASCQPGHSHADTFSYELRVDGQPLIVDTGVSTYNKDERRQYERSTAAHNTVSVGGRDSSHVWGGFRVGSRATVKIVTDDASEIVARHDGFGRGIVHQRRFELNDGVLSIEDEIIGSGSESSVSYLHFAPDVRADIVSESGGVVRAGSVVIQVEGADKLEIRQDKVSTEYNRLETCDVLEMTFGHRVKVTFCEPH